MLCFVPVLCGCVCYVFCFVRKSFLQCMCNYREEGYGPVLCSLLDVVVRFWDGASVCGIMLLLSVFEESDV